MINPEELTTNRIYDQIAAEYSFEFDQNFTQFLKYALLERLTKATDICLDVGISNGIFAIPLARKAKAIYGVDISSNMLDECRRNIEQAGVTNIFVYKRSATNLLFEDASFDLIFSFSTLSLVSNPDRAYSEIVRVLKPGGLAILDITGKFNLSRIYWTRYYKRHGHFGLNYYSLAEIRGIFTTLGLEILETHATGLLTQWKYIPGVRKLAFLEKITQGTRREPDLDYKISQKIPSLANRWYFVLKKRVDP